ncbi:MAG: DUF1674 domain-containing protein [Alphaproteobacteria bacterium PRO2]|nr:DUF1674 domain-containing protein [Alphaproteobacteria bacterium PRO2]
MPPPEGEGLGGGLSCGNSAKTVTPPPDPSLREGSKKKEINGFEDQGMLEPTRYGDWDVKGRCSDF